MRIPAVALLALSLAACGGDSAPLPPLTVGPEWLPTMTDTSGNIMMRRMVIWVDTVNVSKSPAGYAMTAQRMHMDMKIGDISTTMRTQMEVDCVGKRYRMAGLDSVLASVKGRPLPDSLARQAVGQQTEKLNDTTWRSADAGSNSQMVTAVCARAVLDSATPPAASAK